MSLPNASGQSGTASAEPVEVTRPPTKMRQKVAPTASIANRCNARVEPPKVRSSIIANRHRLVGCGGCWFGRLPLRQVVFRGLGRAVFIGPAIHDRHRARPVAMAGGRRRAPLKRVRVPWIFNRLLAPEIAPDNVREEQELRRTEDEGADRDEHVDRLERLEEVVLGRIIDAPHVPPMPSM